MYSRTMQSAWKKLWPESVTERNFEGFEDELMSVMEDIVSLGKSMGLDMDDDVEELVGYPNTELITNELQDLPREQQQMAAEKLSSEEGVGREDIPML